MVQPSSHKTQPAGIPHHSDDAEQEGKEGTNFDLVILVEVKVVKVVRVDHVRAVCRLVWLGMVE